MKFQVTPVSGISPIIIDYNNYKITILMFNGVTIKIFKEHGDRWYKLKDVTFDYFELDECINWVKSSIDNNYIILNDKLLKLINEKAK